MRKISPHAKTLRRNMTDAEKKLWPYLRNRNLDGFKFRRQWTVGRYIADFACIKAKLIIELDGGQHSESDKDAVRTRFLESNGWRVIRFWNHDVLGNVDGVLEEILRALKPPSSNSA